MLFPSLMFVVTQEAGNGTVIKKEYHWSVNKDLWCLPLDTNRLVVSYKEWEIAGKETKQ